MLIDICHWACVEEKEAVLQISVLQLEKSPTNQGQIPASVEDKEVVLEIPALELEKSPMNQGQILAT